MTVEEAGRRVEEVLDRLSAAGGPAARAGDELVRALMDLYGAGLERIVALLGEQGVALDPLLDDALLTSLLVLHDLHPQDTLARAGRALRRADADGAQIAGFTPEHGELRVALPASGGCGCPSGGGARERIESALSGFVPEVTSVVFEAADAPPAEPVLLQIGSRPAAAR